MKKTLLTVLAAAFMVGLPLSAQSGKIDFNQIDKQLGSIKAAQYVEVSLSGLALKLATKMAAKDDPEAAEYLKHIHGIYVRVVEIKKNDSLPIGAVDAIKRQINEPPWERLVLVKGGEGEDDADVNVSVCIDPKKETLKGLVVLAVQDGQFVFVNIVGDFDPDKLDLLEGNFGIPPSIIPSSIGIGDGKKKKDKEPIATTPQKGKIAKDGKPDPKPTKEETIDIDQGQISDAI